MVKSVYTEKRKRLAYELLKSSGKRVLPNYEDYSKRNRSLIKRSDKLRKLNKNARARYKREQNADKLIESGNYTSERLTGGFQRWSKVAEFDGDDSGPKALAVATELLNRHKQGQIFGQISIHALVMAYSKNKSAGEYINMFVHGKYAKLDGNVVINSVWYDYRNSSMRLDYANIVQTYSVQVRLSTRETVSD